MRTSIEKKGDILSDSTDRLEEAPSLLNYTPLTAGLIGCAADEVSTLDADMVAIRARVLGRGCGESVSSKYREVYDELKSRHQIDLNLEANTAILEDPALIAHMEAARRRLAEQEKALLRLPRCENLRTTYLQTMGGLSALIRKLDEEHQTARGYVEIGYHQARVLDELAEGRKPHGSPAFGPASIADPDTKEAMKIASKKAVEIAKSYEELLALVENARVTLFVLRREIEVFGDGLLELVEASEEDRRRLREFLQIATQVKAINVVTDSAGQAVEEFKG